MTARTIEGFFGLAADGSQYRYDAQYVVALGHIIWAATVYLGSEVKGTPGGIINATGADAQFLDHHIRDCVTSSITNRIGVSP